MILGIVQNIYITALVLFLTASLCFILYFYLKPKFGKKHFVSLVGRQLYKLAVDLDLLLINNFSSKQGNETHIINHILFGKKFIYLINDYSFLGALEANRGDKNAVYYEYKGKPKIIKNPVSLVNNYHESFIDSLKGDKSIFKSIIVFNDDIILSIEEENLIKVKRRELNSLIKDFETINFKEFQNSELLEVAKKIDTINKRNKNEI